MFIGDVCKLINFVCPCADIYIYIYIDRYLNVKVVKIEFVYGRTCLCIGTNYSTICTLLWFYYGTLMGLHVLHTLQKYQIIISNSCWEINIFVFLPKVELQTCHALLWERWQSPRPGLHNVKVNACHLVHYILKLEKIRFIHIHVNW